MIFRGAARWLVSALFGLVGASFFSLLILAGVDEQTATGFVQMTQAYLGEAVFILLTVGSARVLGMIKKVDPFKWSELKWARHAGEKVKELPAPVAESKIKSGAI